MIVLAGMGPTVAEASPVPVAAIIEVVRRERIDERTILL
jgi:hypothetical protein